MRLKTKESGVARRLKRQKRSPQSQAPHNYKLDGDHLLSAAKEIEMRAAPRIVEGA